MVSLAVILVAPTIEICAQMDGVVIRVATNEGDRVRRGDLLAQQDPRKLEAASQQQQAQLQISEARYARARQLRENNTMTQQDMDELAAGVQMARAAVELKKVELADASLVAPAEGVVAAIHVRPGQFVTKGTSVAALLETGQMTVEIAAPEQLSGRLRVGQDVDVTPKSRPEARATGKVVFIAPCVDRATGTVRVKARIPNEAERLLSGMSVTCSLRRGE